MTRVFKFEPFILPKLKRVAPLQLICVIFDTTQAEWGVEVGALMIGIRGSHRAEWVCSVCSAPLYLIIQLILQFQHVVTKSRQTTTKPWRRLFFNVNQCVKRLNKLFQSVSNANLPLGGMSATLMKIGSLNSPNFTKACILERMCTSYSFPMCRP